MVVKRSSKRTIDHVPSRDPVRVPIVLDKRNVATLALRAGRAAKKHREICGLVVDHGAVIRLVETRNKSRRAGSFWIHGGDWKALEKAATLLGSRVIGTFHSHIVSPPVPGPGDIRGAIDGHVMLILDGSSGRLVTWRIRGNRAYRLKHEVRSYFAPKDLPIKRVGP